MTDEVDRYLSAMTPEERKAFDDTEAKVNKMADLFMRSFGVKDPARPVSARMTCKLIAEVAILLKQKIEQTDNAKRLPYRGVWKATEEYEPGTFVTANGSMYHADTTSKGIHPGDDPTCWTLCVKRGRDGKDAR